MIITVNWWRLHIIAVSNVRPLLTVSCSSSTSFILAGSPPLYLPLLNVYPYSNTPQLNLHVCLFSTSIQSTHLWQFFVSLFSVIGRQTQRFKENLMLLLFRRFPLKSRIRDTSWKRTVFEYQTIALNCSLPMWRSCSPLIDKPLPQN